MRVAHGRGEAHINGIEGFWGYAKSRLAKFRGMRKRTCQTENWHPKIGWIRLLQGVITIIGALVLTILASYGVGVLGPRWKDE